MPTTPDEFGAAIFVLAVLSALLLVIIGRVVVWVAARVEAWRGVKRYEAAPVPPASPYVTHQPNAPRKTATDPGLSVASSGLSAWSAPLPAPVQAIMIDRTRVGLLAALVAAGWKTGDIRAVLKGDNGKIGEEVEAEQRRQGIIPPPARPPILVAAGRADAYALDRESGARVDAPELRYEPLGE